MTRIVEATEALRAALDAKDHGTIRALRAKYNSLLFTYNPNQATHEERTFELVMQEVDAHVYPRERCGSGRFEGRHMDDCLHRCGWEN